ncbi:MAG: hypothetical protein P8X79_15675 [Reinekea sp.]
MNQEFYQLCEGKPSLMSNPSYSHLTHLDVIHIQGPDAIKFLQGQFTQTVLNMAVDEIRHGAFCTAQGRAVTNVWLYSPAKDNVYLICHRHSAPILATHLQKYIAFFRGTKLIHQPKAYQLIGINTETLDWSGTNNSEAFALQWDHQRHLICYKTGSDQEKTVAQWLQHKQQIPLADWQAADIKARKLWLDDQQAGEWIPQNFSLDELDGISFKKGCYIGQEVIARLHYKGQSKKRLFRLTWKQAPENTQQIYQNGKAVGDILNKAETAEGSVALAIVKVSTVGQPLWLDENEQFSAQLLQ